MRVETGLETFVNGGFRPAAGARAGLLANQAAVDSRLHHAVDLIAALPDVRLQRLFAPEHGFRGVLQDMADVPDAVDPASRLPVVSLYGSSENSLSPSPEALSGLDLLLVDLPDIGSRYYTFAQTLIYCMKTAGQTGTKVVVLDRPNPINGSDFEGGLLLPGCRSFCGYAPIPSRHGLTLGELALMAKRGFGEGEWAVPPISCDLEVIPVRGWRRTMYWDETGLPWVMPSPNMPTLDTAIVYPGACLFEATTVSEGRGTTRPFELLGAPYIDGVRWAAEAAVFSDCLTGARLRPASFVPKFHKWADESCAGVQIHITDRRTFKPLRLALALLISLYRLYPDKFALREKPYEFVKEVPALDLLFGSADFRMLLGGQARDGFRELILQLESFESWYRNAREDYLLY